MRAAYAGAPGAFGHEACVAFLPLHEPVPHAGFEQVIAAVERGETDAGILPISNNAAGETGARELIAKANVRIVSEHELPIRMHLLGLPQAQLKDIRTVVSHPVGLRQCARQIAELGLATEEAPNTAVAAADLRDPSRAVLASEAAARMYGLAILKRDVHDRTDNATRFAVIAREDQ